jgi:hypothetical protein
VIARVWRGAVRTEDAAEYVEYVRRTGIEEAIEADEGFRRFAELIEREGYVARFEGIKYRYLRVDDFLDWTSRSLWSPVRTSTAGPHPMWRATRSRSSRPLPV